MKVMEISAGWGLENLRPRERPDPTPAESQVVVAIEAASINYRDLVMARGGYGRRGGSPPFVPVSDGGGRIVAIGKNVSRVQVGDLVCPHMAQNWIDGPFHEDVWAGMLGGPLDGVLQQMMLVPEQGVVKAPAHLDAAAAASLPCAALTAWNAITHHVKPGDVVLTQGTGGVSLFALQFAKLNGAHVIVTSSSDEKLKRARELGADEGINYLTHPNWEKRAREIAGGGGIDHIVELAGTLDQSVRAVKSGGTVSVIGVLAGPSPTISLGQVVTRAIRLQGVTAGSRRQFEDMVRAIEMHRLAPTFSVVAECMEDAGAAIAEITKGAHFGKICMRMGAS